MRQRLDNPTIRDLFTFSLISIVFLVWICEVMIEFANLTFIDDSPPISIVFSSIIRSAVCALTAMSMVWVCRQKRLFGNYFLHPGHWVIVFVGSIELNELLNYTIQTVDLSYAAIFFEGMTCLLILFGIIFCVLATIKQHGAWRIGFGCLLALVFPIQLFISYRLPLSQEYSLGILPMIIAAPMFVALSVDQRRNRRDWLHWLGFLALLLKAFLEPICWLITINICDLASC